MRTPLLHGLITSFFVVLSSTANAFTPPKQTECIAPANPGGGWDLTCRTMAETLLKTRRISTPMRVTNIPGAGGAVAYGLTLTQRNQDEGLLVAASSATVTRLAQDQYPNMRADQVRWIGALGADFGVIAVSKHSSYQSLKALLSDLADNPGLIEFGGGSARGGWDHLKVLMAAKAGGVLDLKTIRYRAYNGGAEALTQLEEREIDAFSGDVSEVKDILNNDDIRVLAVFSEQRLPAPFDQWPTAQEQGVNTIASNWRGFYMPGESSDEAYQWWVDTLKRVHSSEVWQQVMVQHGLMPFHQTGPAFEQFVYNQVEQISEVSKAVGLRH